MGKLSHFMGKLSHLVGKLSHFVGKLSHRQAVESSDEESAVADDAERAALAAVGESVIKRES